MARLTMVIVMALTVATCAGQPAQVMVGDTQSDVLPEVSLPDRSLDGGEVETTPAAADLRLDDAGDWGGTPLSCSPGEGCFGDKCTENTQCQSGWCTEHQGEGVCTVTCQEECPLGWSCHAVAGSEPDVIYICVSEYANLCRPCADQSDCQSLGGIESVCLDYGEEGSFCGGDCQQGKACPAGFECTAAQTVDGVALQQCVAIAGTCDCSDKSVALGLWTPCALNNSWGTCSGKRVCTDDGLAPCDALLPAQEECNGLDDDCNEQADEPALTEGKLVELCDDGNECTSDSCLGEAGCDSQPLDGVECVDGDPCTAADHCETGLCVGAPVLCDDSNPCTDDSCNGLGGCQYVPNTADCNDSNACSVADQCSEGSCGGVLVGWDCAGDLDCATLEDDNLCAGKLMCNDAELPCGCVVDPDSVVSCPEPEGPEAFCLQAWCDPATGECSLVPAHDGYACDDGNACTIGETCAEGLCGDGMPLSCADDNPCTDDSCDPGTGCEHTPNSIPCNDGDACTAGETCDEGSCTSAAVLDCDDSNPCTDDTCDPQAGCLHAANDAACDDSNHCSADDHCAGGQCIFSALLDCNDDNPCTDDGCYAEGGCMHTLNDALCDDGDLCTTNDHCALGQCLPGPSVICNDSNPCTDDGCGADGICQFLANAASCDDGNACTVNEQCSEGTCKPGGGLDCGDSNHCTNDGCDPAIGCTHLANTAPCDDGNSCTMGETCADGACGLGLALTCNDGNPCTDDACDGLVGCTYTPNAALCDDGDACTTTDQCSGGGCVGGPPPDCDDGDVCTEDSCAPDSGCQQLPLSPCCSNGAVEEGETCDDGNLEDGDGCSAECQLENTSPFDWQGDSSEEWEISNERLVKSPPLTMDTCRCASANDAANCSDNTTAWSQNGETTFSSGPAVMGGKYWDGGWGHESHRGDGMTFRRTGLAVEPGEEYLLSFSVAGLAATISGNAGGENYFPSLTAAILDGNTIVGSVQKSWGPGGQAKNPSPLPGDIGVYTLAFTAPGPTVDLVFSHRYGSSQCMSETHNVNVRLDWVTIEAAK